MAEFVEVIKKKEKMCEYYRNCNRCPIDIVNNHYGMCCDSFMCSIPQEAEKIIMDWEKPVDWSKVEVDTPILVRQSDNGEWTKRHFARYEDDTVFAWLNGQTSYTANKYDTSSWKYAKLAKDGE